MSPESGTPAGTIVVRAAGLRVHGGTVTAGDGVPPAGEPAVFCRPVITAPAAIRRDGTVLADASYREALARLAGLLADIPFAREWHVPTEKVITDWRLPVPPALMEDLFWQAAGPLIADDEPSAVMLAGMPVGAADGMLVNLATRRRTGRSPAPPGPRMIPRRSRSCGWSWSPPARASPGPAPSSGRQGPGSRRC
jgi:hypothetical protein